MKASEDTARTPERELMSQILEGGVKCRSKVALRRQAEGHARHLFTSWCGLPLPTGVLQQLLKTNDSRRGYSEDSRARADESNFAPSLLCEDKPRGMHFSRSRHGARSHCPQSSVVHLIMHVVNAKCRSWLCWSRIFTLRWLQACSIHPRPCPILAMRRLLLHPAPS